MAKKKQTPKIQPYFNELQTQRKHNVLRQISAVFEQQPSFPTFGWDKDRILSAIANHDQGLFMDSELLYHAMMREPRIYSALRTRVEAMRSFRFVLNVNDNAPKILKKTAKILEKNFEVLLSKQTLSEILRRMIMFGFCICRHVLIQDETTGQLIPKIVPWTQSYTYYQYAEKQFHVIAQDEGDIPVAGDGWVVFSTGGERPWLNGAIRPLSICFWDKSQALDAWVVYNDTEARSYKHFMIPPEKREIIETDSLYEHIYVSRGGDTIVTTTDIPFELVNGGGRGSAYKTFEDLSKSADDNISIILLANNLVQEIKGGSHAAATAANSLAREIIESDSENIENGLYSSTMKVWTDLNFSPELYGETSFQQFRPQPELEAKNAENEEIKAKSAKEYSDSFSQFLSAIGPDIANNLQIDFKEAARKAGLPLIEDKLKKDID